MSIEVTCVKSPYIFLSFIHFEAQVDSASHDLSYTSESMGKTLPAQIQGVEYFWCSSTVHTILMSCWILDVFVFWCKATLRALTSECNEEYLIFCCWPSPPLCPHKGFSHFTTHKETNLVITPLTSHNHFPPRYYNFYTSLEHEMSFTKYNL